MNHHATSLCSACGTRPGEIPVQAVLNGRRSIASLCSQCIQETMMAGLGIPSSMAGSMMMGGRGGSAVMTQAPPHAPASATPALDQFGTDLTRQAAEGRLDPVIGRSEEIAQTVEILSRRRKNNAVLIGEAGVGKTAVAEGLAQRIHAGDVPASLQNARLIALDLAGLLAGASMRGQFEGRLKAVLEEAADPDNRVVLFVDELHTILGAGAAEGAMDAANMLKPMLARGDLRLVGATTLAEFRRVERDAALARRLGPVTVGEPSVEETVEILQGLRDGYAEHHGVRISDGALQSAARLGERYITDQQLPDKAIDLMDQAAARLALASGVLSPDERTRLQAELAQGEADKQAAASQEDFEAAAKVKQRQEQIRARLAEIGGDETGEAPEVTEQQVAEVVAARTGVPVGELLAAENERLLALEDDLHARVIGQDEAVSLVADAVRRSRVGLAEADRPLGSFLFLGPTGVGKTELVKALAERLFGRSDAMVRIDMSEFREPHTVARLIGSPPGYVGYGDGGQLTEPVRRRPYSVVLLDEIEKAHPEVWNLLLQVMDDGRLTDGEGRTVDFTNTVLVMTSNLGAGKARHALGFASDEDGKALVANEQTMREAAKKAFLPEFLNRIDEIVCFRALTREQVQQICRIMVAETAERLRVERGVTLQGSDELVAALAEQGFDEEFGARPLRRHLRRTLERSLTKSILAGELPEGATVLAGVGEDGSVVLQPDAAAVAA